MATNVQPNNVLTVKTPDSRPAKMTRKTAILAELLPALQDTPLKPKARRVLAVAITPELSDMTAKDKAKLAGCSEKYYHTVIRSEGFKNALVEQVKGMLPGSLPTVFKALRESAEQGSDKAAIAILTQAGILDKPGVPAVSVNIANIEAIREQNLANGLARFNVQVEGTGGCPPQVGGTADIGTPAPSLGISDNIISEEIEDGQE